jgi:hypothetical protein
MRSYVGRYNSTTTGITSGAETYNSSGVYEFASVF